MRLPRFNTGEREVDTWLNARPGIHDHIFESHPELCFYFLSKRDKKLMSKKINEGQRQRIQILEAWCPGLKSVFQMYSQQFKRFEIQNDDIIDALCLWVTARISESSGNRSVCHDLIDSKGVRMNMHFADPYDRLTKKS